MLSPALLIYRLLSPWWRQHKWAQELSLASLPSPFDNFPPTRKKDSVSVGLITKELFLHISRKSGNPNDDPKAWETPTNGEKDDRDLRVWILLLAYQAVAHMAMSSCMQGTEVSDHSLSIVSHTKCHHLYHPQLHYLKRLLSTASWRAVLERKLGLMPDTQATLPVNLSNLIIQLLWHPRQTWPLLTEEDVSLAALVFFLFFRFHFL